MSTHKPGFQSIFRGYKELAIVKSLGVQIYILSGPQYIQISTIKHNILILCHEYYIEMKKIKYMLEIDILRNSSQKWVSGGVPFNGLDVQKKPG